MGIPWGPQADAHQYIPCTKKWLINRTRPHKRRLTGTRPHKRLDGDTHTHTTQPLWAATQPCTCGACSNTTLQCNNSAFLGQRIYNAVAM